MVGRVAAHIGVMSYWLGTQGQQISFIAWFGRGSLAHLTGTPRRTITLKISRSLSKSC